MLILGRIFGIFLELFSLYLYFRHMSHLVQNLKTDIYQGFKPIFRA